MEQVYEVKKIPIVAVTKIMFIIFLVIGILIALFYSIIFSGLSFIAGGLGDPAFGEEFAIFRNLGLIMIPVIALMYAIMGTIATIIWVLIYNIIASVVGGLELTLKPKGGPTAAASHRESATVPEGPINGF